MKTRRFIMSLIYLSVPLSQVVDLKMEKRAAYFNYNAIRLQFERGTSPRSQHVYGSLYKCKALSNKRLGEGASTIVHSRAF